MFDLETAITDWKQSLTTHEALSPDNVAELEAHLRESLPSLTTQGLSDEEAFIIGSRRIGSGSALEQEYQKENPSLVWVHRVKWMCVGFLFFSCALGIGNLLVGSVIHVQADTFPSWLPFLTSFVRRTIGLSVFLGVPLLLVTRWPSLIDCVYDRFRQRQHLFVLGVIACLAVIPPILDFTIDAVRRGAGGDVSTRDVFASMFTNHLLMAMPVPLVIGGFAILMHQREQKAVE